MTLLALCIGAPLPSSSNLCAMHPSTSSATSATTMDESTCHHRQRLGPFLCFPRSSSHLFLVDSVSPFRTHQNQPAICLDYHVPGSTKHFPKHFPAGFSPKFSKILAYLIPNFYQNPHHFTSANLHGEEHHVQHRVQRVRCGAPGRFIHVRPGEGRKNGSFGYLKSIGKA